MEITIKLDKNDEAYDHDNEEYLDPGHIMQNIEAMVIHKLTEEYKKRARKGLSDAIEKAIIKRGDEMVAEVMEEEWNCIDECGVPTGEKKNLRQHVTGRFRSFLAEKVDSNGKAITDSWSRNQAKTRLQTYIDSAIDYRAKNGMQAEIAKAVAQVKNAINEDVQKKIATAVQSVLGTK